jgi:hypothetical protein
MRRGEPLRLLHVPFGLINLVEDSVELLPREDEKGWRNVAARLAAIPPMFATWRASLQTGLARGMAAAQAYQGYQEIARYLRDVPDDRWAAGTTGTGSRPGHGFPRSSMRACPVITCR